MNPLEKSKTLTLLPPQLKDNGSFANNTYMDTLGFSDARVVFIVGSLDAAIGSGDAATPPKIEEADNSDFSDALDIGGAALSAVIGATDDDKRYAIYLDLRKTHKRYMRVNDPTAGDGATGCNLCILGELSSGQQAPESAAEQGFEEAVYA